MNVPARPVWLAAVCLLLLLPGWGLGQELRRTIAFKERTDLEQVLFSPDSMTFVAVVFLADAGGRRQLRLYDVETGARVATMEDSMPRRLLGFTADGKTLVTSREMRRERGETQGKTLVQVWDVPKRKLRRTFSTPPWAGIGGAITPDGRTLVTCRKGEILLYDLNTGKEKVKFTGPDDWGPLALSRDGSRLAIAGSSSIVSVYDVNTGTRLLRADAFPKAKHQAPFSVVFTPDGKSLACVGGFPREAVLLSLPKGEVRKRVSLHGKVGGYNNVAFTPDGNTLFIPGETENGGGSCS